MEHMFWEFYTGEHVARYKCHATCHRVNNLRLHKSWHPSVACNVWIVWTYLLQTKMVPCVMQRPSPCKSFFTANPNSTLLHSGRPKLYGVLTVLSAIGLNTDKFFNRHGFGWERIKYGDEAIEHWIIIHFQDKLGTGKKRRRKEEETFQVTTQRADSDQMPQKQWRVEYLYR